MIGFPLAYFMARYATGAQKAALYIAVMLPLWSSYLIKVSAWKMLLAKEGIVTWVFEQLHILPHFSVPLPFQLQLPQFQILVYRLIRQQARYETAVHHAAHRSCSILNR